jgi:hypothetical protein
MLKAMLKKLLSFTLALSFVSVLFTSCGTDVTKNQAVVLDDEDAENANSEDEVTYILPSPLQIASIFKRSGMSYVSGIASNPDDINKYTGAFNKALAMGVYSADLAYTVVNKQNQESLTYLKTIRELADGIGLSSVFDSENLLSRFEKNVGNEDSLAYIISDLQIDMDAYLEENEKEHLAMLIFTGAWTESVFIGSKTVEKNNNQKITNRLGEQFVILGNLIKALQTQQKANEQIPMLIAELQTIHELFKNIVVDTESVSEDINEDQLKNLTAAVGNLRARIVEGSF